VIERCVIEGDLGFSRCGHGGLRRLGALGGD
jgi:hypothetical protein